MNRFQSKQILKQANLLDLIPIKLNEYKMEPDGKVSILVPKFKNPLLSKMFIPSSKSKNINVRLDNLGTLVWMSINGSRNVSQIVESMAQSSAEPIDALESRIHQFILMLYKQRFISFTILEK